MKNATITMPLEEYEEFIKTKTLLESSNRVLRLWKDGGRYEMFLNIDENEAMEIVSDAWQYDSKRLTKVLKDIDDLKTYFTQSADNMRLFLQITNKCPAFKTLISKHY